MKKIFPVLLCCLLLCACAKAEPAAPAAAEPTLTPASETAPPAETEAPPAAETQPPMHTVTVYYGDDNAQMLLSKEVSVSEISESVLVDELIAAGVLREGVAVNSMSLEGSRLVLDFNQAFGDLLCSMGTAGEYIILGSTVNSFLSAFDAETLLFTVNGSILETGHNIYDYPLEFFE